MSRFLSLWKSSGNCSQRPNLPPFSTAYAHGKMLFPKGACFYDEPFFSEVCLGSLASNSSQQGKFIVRDLLVTCGLCDPSGCPLVFR